SLTIPLAPPSRNSPPACLSFVEHITMMPTPVLSIYSRQEISSTTLFWLSRSRSETNHSICWHSGPKVILPPTSTTTTSLSIRFLWISSCLIRGAPEHPSSSTSATKR